MSGEPVRVLCLGGGYTAIRLARTLKPAIRRQLVDLTIVSRENFHTFHGFVPDMLAGKIQPGQIISPARRIFPPARFLNANVESIDLAASTVRISRFLDGRDYALPFDHLVLALGSTDDLTRYAGIAEHALRLKTFGDCFRTRNHIIAMLEMAEIEPDPVERRRLLTFVVAGGNFGGVEVATELQEYLESLIRHEYARLSPDELRVVLVHSTPRILPELIRHHETLVAWAERHLSRSGLEFRANAKVEAATGDEILLSNGERIPTRTIISCTGTAQSPLLNSLQLPRDARGRLETDEFVRVRGQTNIWAGGDCAAVPHPSGGMCPPLAIYALTAGRQIARNILRATRGQPPEPYRFTGIGDACSLGRRRAVAHFKGMQLTGVPAWIAWRLLLLRFVPTFDRRVRLVLDWLVWPLVGRDAVNMKVDEPLGLRREHFEPGQEIVREGEIGQRLYLIWEGEVEIVRGAASSEPVMRLGRGQHFGETAIFQNTRRTATVRATTKVELISLGQAEALALSAVAGSFGEAVRKLPGEQA